MRYIKLALAIWTALVAGNSPAQTASPPGPTTPVVRRAPTFASWTITYHYKDDATVQTAPAKGPYLGDRPRIVVVVKTDKIYLEQTTWTSGKKDEKWTFDGVQLKLIAGTKSIVPINPPSKEHPEPDYSDYSKGDFPGLGWISLQNYKGLGNFQGQPVYVFESSSEKKQAAGLSPDTQLPVYSSEGDSVLTYTYNPPPSAPLVPPEAFTKVLKIHKRGLAKLKYSPVPM